MNTKSKYESDLNNKDKLVFSTSEEKSFILQQLKNSNEVILGLEKQVQENLEKIGKIEAENKKMLIEKEEFHKANIQISEKNEKVLNTLKNLQTDFEALKSKHINSKTKKKSEFSSFSNKISELQTTLSNLEQELENTKKMIFNKDSEIANILSEKQTLSSQILDLYSYQEVLRNELELSLKELKQLKEDLKQKNDLIKTSIANINFTREEILT